jgi:hypothetical protein
MNSITHGHRPYILATDQRKSELGTSKILLLLLLLLFTTVEFSLGGSSSYTSTDKANKNKCT